MSPKNHEMLSSACGIIVNNMSPIRSTTLDWQPVLVAAFWQKVKKTRTCWLWTGGRSKGYGLTTWQGRTISAHRLAYAALVGRIPPGKELDHICRNRACVRPDHLRIATHYDNVMAGANFTATNARKFCCPKGHPYAVVKGKKRTQRKCLTCKLEAMAAKRRQARMAKWEQRWAGL